ncbi:RNA methyltransferase [Xylariomycetidae sp. FL2044]|nr:RNA methyltransferase [Xylariomycetidae sp. FL2044]
MRLFNSSSLFCRRHVLLSAHPAFGVRSIPTRTSSSLSAIHRGLRDSHKAKPQGFTHASLKTPATPRTRTRASRFRREGLENWTKPTFKIKRGKKDVTDKGPQPKSRRSRFHDPTESFGKKSFVYQMKTGALKEKLATLESKKPWTSSGPGGRDRMSTTQFKEVFDSSPGQSTQQPRRSTAGTRQSTYRNGPSDSRSSHRDRPLEGLRSRNGSPTFRAGSSSLTRNEPRFSRDSTKNESRSRWETSEDTPPSERNVISQSSGGERDRETPWRKVAEDDGPVRVHHTTAASQFLYGRSVVEAALKDSKRQLYKLYIYSGEERRNVSVDASIEKLANRKAVTIEKLPRQGMRLMDKMSGGRPHNGYVLEASALPQPPVKSLGVVSEDYKKPGFSIELAHQSAEEAQVNGVSDFISHRLPQGRNPFVLLIDSILDPGNLGAILRSAAFMGVNAVAITKHSSATLTPVALKASAGAAEILTLFSVNSTLDFLTRSKESGWMAYAAVPSNSRSRGNSHITLDRVEDYDPLSTRPTILVVGSEGEGLAKPVRRLSDFEVSIPNHAGLLSDIDSLNVSVATGILCAAFLKKQHATVAIENAETPENDQAQLW